MPNKLRNTRSGTAGEMNVIAVLSRCGFNIDKPLQIDDEIDVSIRVKIGKLNITIPIQVKSVQFPDKRNIKHNFIQGLKKKYLERQPYLCLAIYRPETNEIWFINGSKKIQEVYYSQESWNAKHRPYNNLSWDADIRIALPCKDILFNQKWKIPADPCNYLNSRFQELISEIEKNIVPSDEIISSITTIESKCAVVVEVLDISGQVVRKKYRLEDTIEELISSALSILEEFIIPNFSPLIHQERISIMLLRELLVNAIVHRAYDRANDVIIKVMPTSIQVKNPGRLLPPLSLSNNQISGGYVVIRNEKLALQLRQKGLVELVGSGLLWVKKMLKHQNLSPAIFTQDATSFSVTISYENV
ncbi:ATP-binding protein [Microcoleus asticus]|uniref:ATP-dependent DNA helicase RecG C-terminal domain-containing protein n=1 Tax=Microcoleus asticus IPMA8 TaxID=2563858 RepID=A0ABX2D054_9CYAN|nr:ATP-binding protein [Microcoleus asticus]NQE35843.1 hypothetical protein [Microcoleus asticus IPMA8]